MSSKKRKSDSLEDLKVSSTSGATSTKKQSKTFVVKKSKVALKNLAAETTDAEVRISSLDDMSIFMGKNFRFF
jgi:hypothetical protein